MTINEERAKKLIILFFIVVLAVANREYIYRGGVYLWDYARAIIKSSEDMLYTEGRAKEIMNIMEAKDEIALYELFSEYAKKNTRGLGDVSVAFIDRYAAPVSTYKGTFQKRLRNEEERYFVVRYEIDTEYGRFILHFTDIVESGDLERIGIHALRYLPWGENILYDNTLQVTGLFMS